MQKFYIKCSGFFGALIIVSGCAAILDEHLYDTMPMYDPIAPMMMYGGLFGDRNSSFADSIDRGIKFGVVRGISGLTGRALEAALGGGLARVSSAFNSLKKTLLQSIYKNNGFDIRELFGWKNMLESSVSTHILNVAKGARVVRAHVLADQTATTKPVEQQQAVHGIDVLKSDMSYIVAKLDEYEPYYTLKPNGHKRGIVERVLDCTALASGLYVLGDFFIRKTNEKDVVSDIQYWQRVWEEQQRNNQHLVPVTQFNAMIFDRLAHSVNQFKKTSQAYKTNTNNIVKTGFGLFAIVQLVRWLRSQEAVKTATLLSDVNRDLIVHLIGSLRSNLKYLLSLCDGVKEESDLVRVKDDFEFISKNCGDALLQIAFLIDQDETLKMQRLGKPGQAQSQFNQGLAGLAAALPKF